MLPDLFGLAVTAIVLAAASLASRRLRHVMRAAGGPPARPARQPAGRAAVPRPEVQPRGEVTGPFGYDNGVTVEREGAS